MKINSNIINSVKIIFVIVSFMHGNRGSILFLKDVLFEFMQINYFQSKIIEKILNVMLKYQRNMKVGLKMKKKS